MCSTANLDVELHDEKVKDEELGYLKVSLCVTPIPDNMENTDGSSTRNQDDYQQIQQSIISSSNKQVRCLLLLQQ